MIKGMITSVGQLGQPVGDYQIRYQDITILTGEGQTTTGNIGSKLPEGYAINTPICVEVTQDPKHGTKFKRVDPNYAQTTSNTSTVSSIVTMTPHDLHIIRECCIKAAARILTREADTVNLVHAALPAAKDCEAYVLGTTSCPLPPVANKGDEIPF